MRPPLVRFNSAVLAPDRTGRSDSPGAGHLHSPCAGEMDDAVVATRRNHQRDLITDWAAEHQPGPPVEAMRADGAHGAARPAAVWHVGELAAEEFLQETGQRASVQPECLFVHLILPWDPSARTGSSSGRAQALRAGRQLALRTPLDRRRRCAAALSVPGLRP